MKTRVKIRSIYATSLTKLLLEAGYSVVEPSAKIRERFGPVFLDEPFDILIKDRGDLQGVELIGEAESICCFLECLQDLLIDAALVEFDEDAGGEDSVRAIVEFPGASKQALDEARFSVAPTVYRHHRMRIIASQALERAELGLLKHPEDKDALEKRLFFEAVIAPMEKSGIVRLEHVRPLGKAIRPREGVLIDAQPERIAFRRSFSEGRYDGLDLPISPGDYGITTVEEGAWYAKHAYYSKDDKLIGEYYNVNTPVEFYPYGARYLDLEVDVVRRSGERPVLLDREKLALLSKRKYIGKSLESKAMEIADGLMRSLGKTPGANSE